MHIYIYTYLWTVHSTRISSFASFLNVFWCLWTVCEMWPLLRLQQTKIKPSGSRASVEKRLCSLIFPHPHNWKLLLLEPIPPSLRPQINKDGAFCSSGAPAGSDWKFLGHVLWSRRTTEMQIGEKKEATLISKNWCLLSRCLRKWQWGRFGFSIVAEAITVGNLLWHLNTLTCW